ncbi:ABC transporter permease subunit [Streptomyces yangpuensis]|uniref:ABC transporter permease subunit n=1 Tax=Streptomyces yangpuensis TaxID=1648182 RepID=UPI0037128FA2
MIWLTWRQFRTQAVVAFVALAALAIYLVILGVRMRHAYTTDIVGCRPADCTGSRRAFEEAYGPQVESIGALLLGMPALIGVFWGAPLVTRELEEKTDRLVWNQSITRMRWLAVKLTLLTVVSMAVAGLHSLLLTWSASRYDQLIGERFGALTFASRNIAPIGYAAFAFLLGTVIGLLVRRTLPAMALTLALFAVVQVLMPAALRQHLMTPVTSTVKLDVEAMSRADFMGMNESGARIDGYTMPGAWSLTSSSKVFNADGTPYTAKQAEQCRRIDQRAAMQCAAQQNLHFSYTYQPADRYWRFQWIELSAFLGLTLLLAGFGLRRIRTWSS